MKVYVVWSSDDDMSDLRYAWGIVPNRLAAQEIVADRKHFDAGMVREHREYVIKEYELIEIKKEED